MKHTLSVLVENESGVLTRIAGLFARRGFNIESLSVGPAEQKNISRITMVVPGDDKTIEQLTKQLYKLINVSSAIYVAKFYSIYVFNYNLLYRCACRATYSFQSQTAHRSKRGPLSILPPICASIFFFWCSSCKYLHRMSWAK